MSKSKFTIKINNQLEDLNSFIQQKIKFIHPINNSIDMEYGYFNGYKFFSCDVDFNHSTFDLILKFDKINKNEIKIILDDLKNYNLEIVVN